MKGFIWLAMILLLSACSPNSFLPFINFDSAFDTKTRFEKQFQEPAQEINQELFSYLEFPSGTKIGEALDGSVSFIFLTHITKERLEQMALDFRLIGFDLAQVTAEWQFFESLDIVGMHIKFDEEEQTYQVILIKDQALNEDVTFRQLFELPVEEEKENIEGNS